MIRILLAVAAAALALRHYFRVMAAQAAYDESINRMLALVPDDQRADLRSLAEREREPRPRRWQM